MNQLLFDLPREQYEHLEAENWTLLKLMGQSPAHYLHAKKNPDFEVTDTLFRGAAGHVAVLEPEKYGGQVYDAINAALPKDGTLYSVWPAANGKRGTKAWDGAEQLCRLRGQKLIREADHEWCQAIAKAVRACPAALPYLDGPREVTMRWEHHEPPAGNLPGFRVQMKGRTDKVAMREGRAIALVDLKSTVHADPIGFAKEAARLQYHGQAALYVDGYFACTGVRLPFYWIAVEATPPHPVCVYRARPLELDMGRQLYRDLLQRLWACKQSGDFPGYATGEMELEFPSWALPSESEALADLIFPDEEAA